MSIFEGKNKLHKNVEGNNTLIQPIIVDNLNEERQYSISLGIYEKNGSYNAIKGTLEFNDKNGEEKYDFKGNHSIVVFNGYRMGD